MKLENLAKIVIGAYLILPSVEDWAAGGTTIVPSAWFGMKLVSDGLGWKQ